MRAIKALFSDLLSGLTLLSRLPMPAHRHSGAASGWSWPLVGLVIAAPAALMIWLGTEAGIAAGPLAAAVLVVMAMLTGALHEDGLADTADGLFGGQSRERRLEIMKDSRIGSYGTLALLLITLASWSALSALIAKGTAIPALLAMAALSRVPMVLLMAALPAARPNGISASSGRPSALQAVLALILGGAIAAALLGGAFPVPLAGLVIVSLALGQSARARLGGQTGDILGASQQLSFALGLSLLA